MDPGDAHARPVTVEPDTFHTAFAAYHDDDHGDACLLETAAHGHSSAAGQGRIYHFLLFLFRKAANLCVGVRPILQRHRNQPGSIPGYCMAQLSTALLHMSR